MSEREYTIQEIVDEFLEDWKETQPPAIENYIPVDVLARKSAETSAQIFGLGREIPPEDTADFLPIDVDESDRPSIKFLVLLGLRLVVKGFSRVELTPEEDRYVLTFSEGSTPDERAAMLPTSAGQRLVRAIELAAGLDPFLRGRSQTGGLELFSARNMPTHRFRYAITSEPYGTERRIRMRFLCDLGHLKLV